MTYTHGRVGAEEKVTLRGLFLDHESDSDPAEAAKWTAAIDTIPYTVTYHVTHGIIKQSVFAALQQQKAETELAGALDEIFGWTIDFITDIRAGDSFAVLYERKTFEDGGSVLGDVLAAKVVSQGED